MRLPRLLSLLCWLALLGLWPASAIAQPVQFGAAAPATIPPASISQPGLAPPSQLSTPFSPYPSATGAPLTAPQLGAPPPAANSLWPNGLTFPSTTATPYSATPSTLFPNGTATPYAAPPTGAYPGYPSTAQPGYGQQPGVLFPNGVYGPNSELAPYVEPFRIFQSPRFSDTWLYGTDHPTDVQIHDIEFAVTGALPNFLGGTQPLYLTPTFLLHLWDGPQGIAADLPAQAYSAFLDMFWASDPNRPLGLELGVAVGAFTDFDTFNQHSIRVIGEGFGVARLTPTLTLKAGAWYLNRNDLKLLPAGGLVWQPNAQMKFDILFPNPKYTQYLSTIGTSDVWWYTSAEYGGGAWTIQRADGSSDRIDINDYRVKIGIDWINQRNWRGYVEVGYAFHRRVVYVVSPEDNFNAKDTFLIGAGFSF